jgi:hypothetical protein
MCGEPPSIRCEYGYPCPESRCKNGCIVGDLNLDGDVDFSDFWAFQVCFGGSGGGPDFGEPSAECLLRFDFEEDGDVDLVDYHDFEDVLRAPN